MPHVAVHAVKLVVKHGPTAAKLVAKHGPAAIGAGVSLVAFLQKNPDLPTQIQERLGAIAKRIDDVKKDRGDAAQIREKLDIIRDEATMLRAEDDDFAADDTAAWIARANGIEHAVRLAEKQSKGEQKKTFGRLKDEAEAMLAEIITAIAAGGTTESATVGV